MLLEETFVELRDRMCEIYGISVEEFNTKHSYPYPYIRAIVADELYNIGYKWLDIAVVFNMTHSAVYYIVNKLRDVKDLKQFALVGSLYNKFHDSDGTDRN